MNVEEKKAFIFGSIFIMANRLQALGDKLDNEITIKQWMIIAIIIKNNDKKISLNALSKISGSSRQNIKKIIEKLEIQGLVVLKRNKKDLRNITISVSQKCIEYFKSRESKEEEFINKLLLNFNDSEIDSLYNYYINLINNINIMEEKNNEKEGE